MGIPYVSFKLYIVFKMPGRQPSGSEPSIRVHPTHHILMEHIPIQTKVDQDISTLEVVIHFTTVDQVAPKHLEEPHIQLTQTTILEAAQQLTRNKRHQAMCCHVLFVKLSL